MEKKEMFEKNIKLAYKQANIYIQKNNLFNEEEDVIQEALMGLWIAIKTFDESKGYQLSTYAYRCIFDKMSNMNMVRSTRSERSKVRRHSLDVKKISIENNLSSDTDVSIEKSLFSEECIFDLEVCERDNIEKFIENALTKKEKKVIRMKQQNVKQCKIAEELKCTRGNIGNILVKIRKKWGKWNEEKTHIIRRRDIVKRG